MNKYAALGEYLRARGEPRLLLTFAEIEAIAGVPMDHSFLKYKKELLRDGYEAEKISLRHQTVQFVQREARI